MTSFSLFVDNYELFVCLKDVPIKMEWDEVDVLSQRQSIDPRVALNVTQLLDEDYSIPFIARYRKEENHCLTPDKLRDIKENYKELK